MVTHMQPTKLVITFLYAKLTLLIQFSNTLTEYLVIILNDDLGHIHINDILATV